MNLNEFFNIRIVVCGDFCVEGGEELKLTRATGYLKVKVKLSQ
jgi:hypothetical protein